MRLFDPPTLTTYLREQNWLTATEKVQVRPLTGGVSNAVFWVERLPPAEPFVVKQAREQLQVAEPWFCSVARIQREIAVLRCYGSTLGNDAHAGSVRLQVPTVLFEDPDEYLYGMSAAPPQATTWKEQLLMGNVALSIAAAAGTLLANLHAGTWGKPNFAAEFADCQFFDDLRLDPYYRHVAREQPELQPAFADLIASLAKHRLAVVHGDFSPKNLLVTNNSLTLLDFEVGHYGDPAFDVGFFFTHLVLKWLWSGRRDEYWQNLTAAWEAYAATLATALAADDWTSMQQRCVQNLGGCLLARVAGKSKVDYLSPQQQALTQQLGRILLCDPPLAELPVCVEQGVNSVR